MCTGEKPSSQDATDLAGNKEEKNKQNANARG